MTVRASALGLDPAHHQPHALHRMDANRVWLETNCYVDLWIEIMGALRLDPVPALGFTFAVDFEGDQWTFFKIPLGDLQALYGLDTQELAIWKAPVSHALEQLARGRVVLMELDSFHLPDTAGTAYRREHVKTTVGIESIDLDRGRMTYFHNAGFFEVQGADFASVLRLDDPPSPDNPRLPPYTEFVKTDRLRRPNEGALADRALALARAHLERRPPRNPFELYAPRLHEDLEALRAAPAGFHGYAFATVRQFGAAFELAGDFCRWLLRAGVEGLGSAAEAFGAIASEARTLQLKLARAVTVGKPFDPTPTVHGLAERWATAMSTLVPRLLR